MAAGRDRRRRRGGQSLVEFAVVLPVFLLILAGILDFGLGLYSQMTVINAAREGARLGVVEPGNVADIKARVDAMAGGLDKSRLTISVTCQHSDGSACSGTWASTDTDSDDRHRQGRLRLPDALAARLREHASTCRRPSR